MLDLENVLSILGGASGTGAVWKLLTLRQAQRKQSAEASVSEAAADVSLAAQSLEQQKLLLERVMDIEGKYDALRDVLTAEREARIEVMASMTQLKLDVTNDSGGRVRELSDIVGCLIEHSPVATVFLSMGNHFERVNEAASDLLGYRPGELLRLDLKKLVCDLEPWAGYAKRVVEGDIVTFTAALSFVRKDGVEERVNITASLVRDEEGKPNIFVCQLMPSL